MKGNLSPHLREVVGNSERESSIPQDEPGLPSLAEGDYAPYGLPANRPLVSIHFITPDGRVRSFQNRHLDSDSRFDHGQITLQFLGFRPIKVVIEGRHLWQLYSYIHLNRCAWIMQAARNFANEGEPIVSKLTFIDLVDADR